MPPKYFAFIDGSQQGPFELDQLVKAGVRPSTYVWCKGMDDWQRADSVEEIRNLFRNHISSIVENHSAQNHEPDFKVHESRPEEEVRKDQPRAFGIPVPEQPTHSSEINNPPQVSLALALLSMFLCFPLTGILAVWFTFKSQKCWTESIGDEKNREELRIKCHEYERLAKMWTGLTVAFGLIFWTLIFSVNKQG